MYMLAPFALLLKRPAVQVFEIEEERMASAISDGEDSIPPPKPSPGLPPSSPTKPTSPAAGPSSPSSPTPPPRHRATSILARPEAAAQHLLSPLAQVFAIPEGHAVSAGAPGADGLSYGSATRLRRASTHKRVGSDSHPGAVGRAIAGRMRASPLAGSVPLPSPSADTRAAGPGPGPAETAAEIEEEEGSGGVPAMWAKRLTGIEERQGRIEALLSEIAQSLKR
jgi:hypothetical protein